MAPAQRAGFRHAGLAVVTFPSEIGVANACCVREEVLATFGSGAFTVIADLTAATFRDSLEIGVLVRAHKQALAEGGGLRVILPASGSVPRIFALTGLDQWIPQFTRVEQAVAEVPDRRVRPRGPGPSSSTSTTTDLEQAERGQLREQPRSSHG